jgi:hypothetical protein
MKPIPDSEIARHADRLLRGTCAPFLVNHCLRSYLWGAALAEVLFSTSLCPVPGNRSQSTRRGHLDPICQGGVVQDKEGSTRELVAPPAWRAGPTGPLLAGWWHDR